MRRLAQRQNQPNPSALNVNYGNVEAAIAAVDPLDAAAIRQTLREDAMEDTSQ